MRWASQDNHVTSGALFYVWRNILMMLEPDCFPWKLILIDLIAVTQQERATLSISF